MQFNLSDGSHELYKPGQVWKYTTRDGEEASELTILKIDKEDKIGLIFHIFVNNLKLKNKMAENGISSTIMHMPFTEESLTASTTEKIKDDSELPDFMEGYDTWRKAFESGKAGIFTLTVKDAIAAMEEAINS